VDYSNEMMWIITIEYYGILQYNGVTMSDFGDETK
jgi:hypothetical protein